ncbi:hypothetical protein D3870_21820 [Noviherbaspirillum cavernae]|uniref:SbsA Ig-like domain-containing protein n=1 Tax=Noviherbaspirillum cavernae TaxID=2320862 RepID=A0A418WUU1_9BURK|nr:Ig-like domain-containing protein [Noviherbaspirillum cavernae]RJF96460.1 hypothetical protein D3870_18535 [Noviherbaspirillum cavernae]RJF96991.1 hypothetical protein D3870_21820 [Noviherbaspirillum cavernae]
MTTFHPVSATLRHATFIGLAASILLAGCGGSGSSNTDIAPTVKTMSVSASTPADGATDVARDVAPQLLFSAGLGGATATAANVSLRGANLDVPATLAVAGTQITLTPARQLLPLTRYTLQVNTALSGTGGEKLAGTRSLTFTTRDGAWKTAQLTETDDADTARDPQIAVDAGGNALAVWSQSDGTRFNILANRYTAGSGWGSAQAIETGNASGAFVPHIAIDAGGNAIAVWCQTDGTRFSIWANRYSAGSGWGSAQLIESDNASDAYDPRIAFDAAGNALVVWTQSDGTRFNVWANRYTVGTGWGAAQLIETDNAGDALFPRIAIDGSGNALAVWQQSDGAQIDIRANRYTVGAGWGTAQLIETGNAGDARLPQIAFDASGNALAVWTQSDGTRYSIWSNRYTAGSGWGTPQLVETDNADHAFDPQIAIDAGGNALAVWTQSDGTRVNVWANRYTTGKGWGTAQLLETENGGDASNPQIAFDAAGNALAVWTQDDGTRNNIWGSRYATATGWRTARPIQSRKDEHAGLTQIAIDASGNALAVWQQNDGTRDNIWVNRFD